MRLSFCFSLCFFCAGWRGAEAPVLVANGAVGHGAVVPVAARPVHHLAGFLDGVCGCLGRDLKGSGRFVPCGVFAGAGHRVVLDVGHVRLSFVFVLTTTMCACGRGHASAIRCIVCMSGMLPTHAVCACAGGFAVGLCVALAFVLGVACY